MSDVSGDEGDGFSIRLGYVLDDAEYKKARSSIEVISKLLDQFTQKKAVVRLDVDDNAKSKLDMLFDATQFGHDLLPFVKMVSAALKQAWNEGIEQPLANLATANKAGLKNTTIVGLQNAGKAFGVAGVDKEAVAMQQELLNIKYEGDFNAARAVALSQMGGSAAVLTQTPAEQRLEYLVSIAANAFQRNQGNEAGLSEVYNRVVDMIGPAFADLLMRFAAGPASDLRKEESVYGALTSFGLNEAYVTSLNESLRQADINSKNFAEAMANINSGLKMIKTETLTSKAVSEVVGAASVYTNKDAMTNYERKSEMNAEQAKALYAMRQVFVEEALAFVGNTTPSTKAGKALTKDSNSWLYKQLGITSLSSMAWSSNEEFELRRESLNRKIADIKKTLPKTEQGAQEALLWDVVSSSMGLNSTLASSSLQKLIKEAVARVSKANPNASEEDLKTLLAPYIMQLPGGSSFLNIPKILLDYAEEGQSEFLWGQHIAPKKATQDEYIEQLYKFQKQLKETFGVSSLQSVLEGTAVGTLTSTVQIDLTINGERAASVSSIPGSSITVQPQPINLNKLGALYG